MTKLLKNSGLVCGLAAACFLSAKAAGWLVTPPLNVSPLWPPAGLGVAALLLLGKRLWPGIAAGAFLASLTAPEMAGIKLLPALAGSLGVALGSTLAAWVGAELAQRFARGRAAFERPSTVFRFIALTAIL